MKRSAKLLRILSVLFLVTCQNLDAQETEIQNVPKIEAYLDGVYESGEINGNVLVVKDSQTIFAKSYGFADSAKTDRLNEDHRFCIGSVYKEFPAVAIMQLVEADRISLDDLVSEYVSDLPPWSKKVTLRHLLQYSSGLPTIAWEQLFSEGKVVTEADLLKGIRAIEELAFEPGSDYLYSNNNPILLIKVVENVTKSTFVEYVAEHFLKRLGMNGTVMQASYPFPDKSLMAIPFNTEFETDDYQIAVSSLLFTSTAEDLRTWIDQLGDFKIISEQSMQTLSQEAIVGDNIQAPLGRCDWKGGKITEHSHHGSSGSYECVVRRFKQDKISIVILTNQKHRNVYDISDKLYKLVTQSE